MWLLATNCPSNNNLSHTFTQQKRQAFEPAFFLIDVAFYSIQIINPKKRILKGCFVVKWTMPETTKVKKQMVFLWHAARPPLWIIPMWGGKVVLLPCGGPEPIDEFVAPEDEIKIANNQLAGWTTCRFDESAAITGSVSGESGIGDGTLLGTTGLVPTDKGEWEWIVDSSRPSPRAILGASVPSCW